MPTISSVTARQILDSRGYPTVEATVTLSDGTIASSSSPSGSVHDEKLEAAQLRDTDQQDYFGRGVQKAVQNINQEIQQTLIGQDPLYQTKVDQTLVDLDGTKNKARLGGNAILAVSQAVMKAAAASLRLPLFVYVKEKYQLIEAYRIPTPIFNLINGGKHGGGTLDFQEFQLVPASHLPYSDALRVGVEMFMAIEQTLEQKGALRTVGLEGGFSPNLATNSDALDIFQEATKLTRYNLSKDAFLGIDLGPKGFFKNNKYTIKDRTQPMSNREFIKYLKTLHEQYRVFSFEDPLIPSDWDGWKALTQELGDTSMIMADDLVLTSKTLLMKAIEEKAANSIIVKPNRAGTVTETIEVVSIARQAGWHTVMSHRSSETNDDFLADIAVGIGTDYVKFGAPSRGERVSKYNRLLRIEEILRASQQSATMNKQDPGRTMMSDEPKQAAATSQQPTNTAPMSETNLTPIKQTDATDPAAQTSTQAPAAANPTTATATPPVNTTPAAAPQSAPPQPTAPQPATPAGTQTGGPGTAQQTPTMHPNPTSPPASQPAAQPPVNPAQQPQQPQVTPAVPQNAASMATTPQASTGTKPQPELTIDDSASNEGVAATTQPVSNQTAAQQPSVSGQAATTASNAPQTEQTPATPSETTGNTTNPAPPTPQSPGANSGDDIQASLNELAQAASSAPPSDKPAEPAAPPAGRQPDNTANSGPASLPKPTPPVEQAPAQQVENQKPPETTATPAGLQPPTPPQNK